MPLRDYQDTAGQNLFEFLFSRPGNPLVCLPTGTGKSFCIADACWRANYYIPGCRIVIATHSKTLVDQNAEELRGYWFNAEIGIYSASLKRKDPVTQFNFVGIDSVYKIPEYFGFVHLLLIDEAHLVDATEGTRYALFIAGLMKANPGLRVVGFSATAWRLKTGSLVDSGIFTDVCYDGCSYENYLWFEQQGYLAKLVGRRTTTFIDVSEVGHTGNDFNLKELAEVTDERITRLALEETADLAFSRRSWLTYGTTISHVERIAELSNEMGIPSIAIHSKSKVNLKEVFGQFKEGRYRQLVSQGMLTTGVNLPFVDLICSLRATDSSALHVQIMGRGTRPVFAPGYDLTTAQGRLWAQQAGPKQDCLMLDYARNIERLGPINDPLMPQKKKKGGGGGGGEAPVRCCMVCDKYSHASASVCMHCGAEFPVRSKLSDTASDASPVSTSEPEYNYFKVTTINYHLHKAKGKATCLRVTYHCGLQGFSEYIHPEAPAGSEPHRRAMAWLRERGMHLPVPHISAQEAFAQNQHFREVVEIKVWTNKKYPEIVGVLFKDGGKSVLEGASVPQLNFK